MSLEQLDGYSEAVKALEANMSPRAQHMRDLERYVEGTQYDGKPDWFSDAKPLWERAPCIVYPIVQSAIDSNSDLLLGESRFPCFGLDGLEGEDAEEFDSALLALVNQARLKAAAREIFAAGQASGSACAIFGVRGGRLFIDTTRARWCDVKLDVDGAVTSLEIRYPYIAIEMVGGRRRAVAKVYRRTIDDQRDTTYLPAEARLDGAEPQWTADSKQNIAHALGFCPVVWYPFMRGCAIVGDVDGRAIHEHLTDEIRAHDFALSQRHRAALYTGDPQWTEIGVEPGYNPSGQAGRRVEVAASVSGRVGDVPHASYVSGPRGGKTRKKSPGGVWQYEAKDVKVQLHTLPGDALKAIDEHARDIRIKLAEALGVVFIDPETIPKASTLSGRALEALRQRQIDRCDQYRADFGDRALLPSMGMLIRIAQKKQLKVVGFEAIAKAIVEAEEQWSWRTPPLTLTWGSYYQLDSDEEQKQVALVAQAKDAGLATTRAAVEKLRPIFDIKDIDAYLEDLEEEKQEALEKQQQLAADMMGADGGGSEDGGTPPRGNRSARPGKAGAADSESADRK